MKLIQTLMKFVFRVLLRILEVGLFLAILPLRLLFALCALLSQSVSVLCRWMAHNPVTRTLVLVLRRASTACVNGGQRLWAVLPTGLRQTLRPLVWTVGFVFVAVWRIYRLTVHLFAVMLNDMAQAFHVRETTPTHTPDVGFIEHFLVGKQWRKFKQEMADLMARLDKIQQSGPALQAIETLSPFGQERTIIVISSILINVLALALPLLMLQLYDRILPHQSLETLTIFSIAVAVAIALESLIRIIRSYITAWISARFEHRAIMAVVDRIMLQPLHEFELKGTGAVMEDFKSVSTLKYHYSGQTFQQWMDLPFVFLYVLILTLINVWVGLLLICGYSVFVFVTWRNGRHDPELIKQQKESDLRRGNFLNEIFKNIHTLKAMTMESLMLRRYERLQESCAKVMLRMTYALDMSSGIGQVFSSLMTVLIVALGAFLVTQGRLTNGELAACVLLGMRSLAPLQRLSGMWSKYQQDEVLRDRLVALLQQSGLKQPKAGGDQALEAFRGKPIALDMQSVRYSFPKSENALIADCTLSIAAGECVMVEGESGAGRSILLQLLAGVLTPDSGQVLLDQHDLRALGVDGASSYIAYLPQKAVMLEGSILDNITLFDPSRTELALQIATELGLDRFVAKMPRGWDSPIGDMATDSLPPGYQQRIAIVRALSSNPSIILFDDATSAMDSEGDANLLKYLEKARKNFTMVLVTQRPSFRKLADRRVRLSHGHIQEVALTAMPEGVSERWGAELEPVTPGALPVVQSPVLPTQSLRAASANFFESHTQKMFLDGRKWEDIHDTVQSNFKEVDDLSDCLALLLKLLNARDSAREVSEALPYFMQNLDLTGFQNAMAQLSYKVSELNCHLSDIDPRSVPCLFIPDHTPAFVVTGCVDGQIRVARNLDTPSELLQDTHVRGRALFYEYVERKPSEIRSWVANVILRFTPMMVMATVTALLSGLVMMTSSLFLTVVYSTVIPTGAQDTLAYLTVGAVVAIAVSYFFMRHRAKILAFVAGRVEYIFGTEILKRVLQMAPSYTERASVSSQVTRLQSFDAIRDVFTGPLASTIFESPATLVILVGLSIINPVALLIFVAMAAIYALLYRLFLHKTQDFVVASSKASSRRNAFLIEMVSKMRIIHECGGSLVWRARLRDISANATMASFHAEQLASMLVGISYFFMMLSALLIVAFTTPLVLSQTLSSGALIASMILMWRVLSPLQTIFVNMTRVERVRGAGEQINALMKIAGERQDYAASPISRGLQGRVEFSRVSFRYSLNLDPALVGVDFRIEPGEMVAISGPNGGGKSTLFKLMMAMYQAQSGGVLVDGVDIRQLDPLELRRLIGYAPQEAQLFRATIAQNLRLARPDATDQQILQALEMAGALDQVLALPRGLEYRVGDNTNSLPSSLKQKISLARAYITRAPIMLFDEPGNALDSAGDRYFTDVMTSLKGKSTVLFISHRPSQILLADTLLVFDKGYLRAAAPPADILKQTTVTAIKP